MKLILQINNARILYPSLKAIQQDFPQYEYHQLRQIYLQSKGIERKMHRVNKELFEQIKIYDYNLTPIIQVPSHCSPSSALVSE
jgi:hypothetical protein